jgi:hypothetical protein
MDAFLLSIRGQEQVSAGRGTQYGAVVANATYYLPVYVRVQTLLQARYESKFAKGTD